MTLFEKIINREIPANIVYEDEKILAFHDVDPKAPVHVLIIPKRVIARIGEAEASDAMLLGQLLAASPKIAETLGVLDSGYRLVINHGQDAGETVPHLHVHLLGGRPLAWPPARLNMITLALPIRLPSRYIFMRIGTDEPTQQDGEI